MTANIVWLLALGPCLLVLVAIGPGGAGPLAARALADRAFMAALAGLATAVVALVLYALQGPLSTPTVGAHGVGFSLYVDALSATVGVLVSFVGAAVVRYSRNYLDGDPAHARFLRWLCATLASVLLTILSGNLLLLVVAWIATSMSLNRLLLFYRERPNAVLAARKKFVVSRLGDLCLVVAMALAWQLFGSLDTATIALAAKSLAAAHAGGAGLPGAVHAIAALLAVAALLKSAQFPTHGWLLEVMETPTPVSALLHAGVVNAGGFLLLRYSDLLSLSTPALATLIVVGGFTALFASVVMLTQTSVKVSLAYSTVAQMGFMLLQCGLGAFAPALLHIVAHSLYKAHAFLSSGSVIDLARASWTPSPGGAPHPARVTLAVGLLIAIGLVVGTLFGATVATQPAVVALGAIVLLGLVHLVVVAIDERPNVYVVGRALGTAVLVAVAYFALQRITARLMAGSLPPAPPVHDAFDSVAIVLVVLGFAAITVFQNVLPRHAGEPRWQALYAHLSNGLYANTLANRLVIRLWPAPPPPPLSSTTVRARRA